MLSGVHVQINRIDESSDDLPLPAYATEHSAGMDLRAAVRQEMIVPPGTTTLIPTGFAIALPEGFEAQVRPRSGLAIKHQVGIMNSPGTIDADYRGEIKVILANFGKEDFIVHRGDRIAQLVVAPYTRVHWEEQEALGETTRGAGGFGHTGR